MRFRKWEVGMQRILTLAATISLMGCTARTAPVPITTAGSARRDIEAAHVALTTALKTGDVRALRGYIETDAIAWLGADGRLGGREAIVGGAAATRAGGSQVTLEELHVYQGVAYEVGVVTNAGHPLGRYSAVWKLDPDGTWRLYRLMAAGQLVASR